MRKVIYFSKIQQNQSWPFLLCWKYFKYFQTGHLKAVNLSLIHISQGLTVSHIFQKSVRSEQKGVILWASNIVKLIIRKSGIEIITDQDMLILLVITPTLFFLFLIFTISKRGLLWVIGFTLLFLPVSVAWFYSDTQIGNIIFYFLLLIYLFFTVFIFSSSINFDIFQCLKGCCGDFFFRLSRWIYYPFDQFNRCINEILSHYYHLTEE